MKTGGCILAVLFLLTYSAFGQVAGLWDSPLRTPEFVTIDFPGAFATHAYGINNAGRIVGSYDVQNGAVTHAFALYGSSIRKIDPANSFGYAEANAINNRGFIVGDFDSQQGFLLRDAKYKQLAFDSLSAAVGVNDGGLIVGFFASQCCDLHGYLYNPKNGRFLQIDYPGALRTIAEGINSSNTIVGIWRDTSDLIHGFTRDNGTISNFDLLGAAQTFLFSINTAGTMAGTYQDLSGLYHGFVFRNGVTRTVDLPGAVATSVYSLNDLGMIAGDYTDSSGVVHGFFGSL